MVKMPYNISYVNLLQLRNMPEVITKLIIITIYFNYYFVHLGYLNFLYSVITSLSNQYAGKNTANK